MEYEKLNRAELSKLLVEKHKNLMEEYGKEFELLQRIYVLKEKRDQLEYWLDESKDDPKKNGEYRKAAEAAENELLTVNEEIKDMYSKPRRSYGPATSDRNARYKWLGEQVRLHEEGMKYWSDKILELENSAKQAELAAEEEKAEKKASKTPLKKQVKQAKKTKAKTSKTKAPEEKPAKKPRVKPKAQKSAEAAKKEKKTAGDREKQAPKKSGGKS